MTGPIRLDCRIVRDHEVIGDYPGAITEDFHVYDWNHGTPDAQRAMCVFEVDDVVLVHGFQPVEMRRRRFFRGYCYDSLFGRDTHLAGDDAGYVLDIPDAEELSGRVALIGGGCAGNYYHGLMNWYARIALLKRMAPAIFDDPGVRFLVDDETLGEPFAGIVAALGLPEDRVIRGSWNRTYRIERAVLVSFVHEGDISPELFATVAARARDVLGIPERTRGSRRVWISCEHLATPRRRILNIDEVADLLDRHGFERIALETLSVADQIRLMSDADVVAGSHGAGFANMIFTPPACGFAIVEKDFSFLLGIDRLFANIARSRGQTVEVVPASSVRLPDVDYGDFIAAHWADAIVDRDALQAAFERVAPIGTTA